MFPWVIKFKDDEQGRQPEEKGGDESVKVKSADEFLRSPEARKFVSDWNNKEIGPGVKFTKRGISGLLRESYLQYKSETEAIKVAHDLLTKLSGKDMFGKLLNAFKIVPEGLRKIVGGD